MASVSSSTRSAPGDTLPPNVLPPEVLQSPVRPTQPKNFQELENYLSLHPPLKDKNISLDLLKKMISNTSSIALEAMKKALECIGSVIDNSCQNFKKKLEKNILLFSNALKNLNHLKKIIRKGLSYDFREEAEKNLLDLGSSYQNQLQKLEPNERLFIELGTSASIQSVLSPIQTYLMKQINPEFQHAWGLLFKPNQFDEGMKEIWKLLERSIPSKELNKAQNLNEHFSILLRYLLKLMLRTDENVDDLLLGIEDKMHLFLVNQLSSHLCDEEIKKLYDQLAQNSSIDGVKQIINLEIKKLFLLIQDQFGEIFNMTTSHLPDFMIDLMCYQLDAGGKKENISYIFEKNEKGNVTLYIQGMAESISNNYIYPLKFENIPMDCLNQDFFFRLHTFYVDPYWSSAVYTPSDVFQFLDTFLTPKGAKFTPAKNPISSKTLSSTQKHMIGILSDFSMEENSLDAFQLTGEFIPSETFGKVNSWDHLILLIRFRYFIEIFRTFDSKAALTQNEKKEIDSYILLLEKQIDESDLDSSQKETLKIILHQCLAKIEEKHIQNPPLPVLPEALVIPHQIKSLLKDLFKAAHLNSSRILSIQNALDKLFDQKFHADLHLLLKEVFGEIERENLHLSTPTLVNPETPATSLNSAPKQKLEPHHPSLILERLQMVAKFIAKTYSFYWNYQSTKSSLSFYDKNFQDYSPFKLLKTTISSDRLIAGVSLVGNFLLESGLVEKTTKDKILNLITNFAGFSQEAYLTQIAFKLFKWILTMIAPQTVLITLFNNPIFEKLLIVGGGYFLDLIFPKTALWLRAMYNKALERIIENIMYYSIVILGKFILSFVLPTLCYFVPKVKEIYSLCSETLDSLSSLLKRTSTLTLTAKKPFETSFGLAKLITPEPKTIENSWKPPRPEDYYPMNLYKPFNLNQPIQNQLDSWVKTAKEQMGKVESSLKTSMELSLAILSLPIPKKQAVNFGNQTPEENQKLLKTITELSIYLSSHIKQRNVSPYYDNTQAEVALLTLLAIGDHLVRTIPESLVQDQKVDLAPIVRFLRDGRIQGLDHDLVVKFFEILDYFEIDPNTPKERDKLIYSKDRLFFEGIYPELQLSWWQNFHTGENEKYLQKVRSLPGIGNKLLNVRDHLTQNSDYDLKDKADVVINTCVWCNPKFEEKEKYEGLLPESFHFYRILHIVSHHYILFASDKELKDSANPTELFRAKFIPGQFIPLNPYDRDSIPLVGAVVVPLLNVAIRGSNFVLGKFHQMTSEALIKQTLDFPIIKSPTWYCKNTWSFEEEKLRAAPDYLSPMTPMEDNAEGEYINVSKKNIDRPSRIDLDPKDAFLRVLDSLYRHLDTGTISLDKLRGFLKFGALEQVLDSSPEMIQRIGHLFHQIVKLYQRNDDSRSLAYICTIGIILKRQAMDILKDRYPKKDPFPPFSRIVTREKERGVSFNFDGHSIILDEFSSIIPEALSQDAFLEKYADLATRLFLSNAFELYFNQNLETVYTFYACHQKIWRQWLQVFDQKLSSDEKKLFFVNVAKKMFPNECRGNDSIQVTNEGSFWIVKIENVLFLKVDLNAPNPVFLHPKTLNLQEKPKSLKIEITFSNSNPSQENRILVLPTTLPKFLQEEGVESTLMEDPVQKNVKKINFFKNGKVLAQLRLTQVQGTVDQFTIELFKQSDENSSFDLMQIPNPPLEAFKALSWFCPLEKNVEAYVDSENRQQIKELTLLEENLHFRFDKGRVYLKSHFSNQYFIASNQRDPLCAPIFPNTLILTNEQGNRIVLVRFYNIIQNLIYPFCRQYFPNFSSEFLHFYFDFFVQSFVKNSPCVEQSKFLIYEMQENDLTSDDPKALFVLLGYYFYTNQWEKAFKVLTKLNTESHRVLFPDIQGVIFSLCLFSFSFACHHDEALVLILKLLSMIEENQWIQALEDIQDTSSVVNSKIPQWVFPLAFWSMLQSYLVLYHQKKTTMEKKLDKWELLIVYKKLEIFQARLAKTLFDQIPKDFEKFPIWKKIYENLPSLGEHQIPFIPLIPSLRDEWFSLVESTSIYENELPSKTLSKIFYPQTNFVHTGLQHIQQLQQLPTHIAQRVTDSNQSYLPLAHKFLILYTKTPPRNYFLKAFEAEELAHDLDTEDIEAFLGKTEPLKRLLFTVKDFHYAQMKKRFLSFYALASYRGKDLEILSMQNHLKDVLMIVDGKREGKPFQLLILLIQDALEKKENSLLQIEDKFDEPLDLKKYFSSLLFLAYYQGMDPRILVMKRQLQEKLEKGAFSDRNQKLKDQLLKAFQENQSPQSLHMSLIPLQPEPNEQSCIEEAMQDLFTKLKNQLLQAFQENPSPQALHISLIPLQPKPNEQSCIEALQHLFTEWHEKQTFTNRVIQALPNSNISELSNLVGGFVTRKGVVQLLGGFMPGMGLFSRIGVRAAKILFASKMIARKQDLKETPRLYFTDSSQKTFQKLDQKLSQFFSQNVDSKEVASSLSSTKPSSNITPIGKDKRVVAPISFHPYEQHYFAELDQYDSLGPIQESVNSFSNQEFMQRWTLVAQGNMDDYFFKISTFIKEINDRSQANRSLQEKVSLEKRVKSLTLPKLISLFLSKSRENVMKKLGLTQVDEYEKIEESLIKILILGTRKNQVERNQFTLHRSYRFDQPKQLLLAFLAYEYFNNKWLRPKQATQFMKLFEKQKSDLTKSQFVLELIMGQGKTSFGMPVISQLFNDQSHFSVLVFESAVFPAHSRNVANITEKSFHQMTTFLPVTRSRPLSSYHLWGIFKMMKEALEKRANVSGKKVDFQSLELKFQEICFQASTHALDRETESILLSYARILDFLSLYGIGNGDESHLLFEQRKHLNYPLGSREYLKSSEIETMAFTMESFLLVLQNLNLLPMLKENKQTFLQGELYQGKILPLMIQKIIHRSFPSLEPQQTKKLTSYLMNLEESCPDWLSLEQKSTVAMIRGIALIVLPKCLSQISSVDFGSSLQEHNGAFARPYEGNRLPLENSIFASPHITIIKTFLHFLQKRPSTQEIDQFLIWLKKKEKNLQQSAKEVLKKKFQNFLPKNSTYSLDHLPTEPEEREKFLKELQTHDAFVIFFVEKIVCPEIFYYKESLQSNAQNLAAMFARFISSTGTPYNLKTYPRITDFINDPGTIGETVRLLEEKEHERPLIQSSNALNPLDLLQNILKQFFVHETQKYYLLADTGALFRGFSNFQIASEILTFVAKERPTIRGVVFHNENKEEMILERGSAKAIPLSQSKLSKEERIVFLGNGFTFGVDIALPMDNHSVHLMGEKTTLTQLLQSVMRDRGLKNKNHSLTFFTTSDIFEKIFPKKTSLDQLLQYTRDQERSQLENDHFQADIQKLFNILRHRVLKKIYKASDAKTMLDIFRQNQDLFVHPLVMNPFELYGKPQGLKDPKTVLEEYKQEILKKIPKTLFSETEVKAIEEEIKSIGTDFETFYPDKVYATQALDALDQTAELSEEQQALEEQEVELNIHNDQEQEQEISNPSFSLKKYPPVVRWNPYLDLDHFDWLSEVTTPKQWLATKMTRFLLSKAGTASKDQPRVALYSLCEILNDSEVQNHFLKTKIAQKIPKNIFVTQNFCPLAEGTLFHNPSIPIGSHSQRKPILHILVATRNIASQPNFELRLGILDQYDFSYFSKRLKEQRKLEALSSSSQEALIRYGIYDIGNHEMIVTGKNPLSLDELKKSEEFMKSLVWIKFLAGEWKYSKLEKPILKSLLRPFKENLSSVKQCFKELHSLHFQEHENLLPTSDFYQILDELSEEDFSLSMSSTR